MTFRPYQFDLDMRRRNSPAKRRCIQAPTGSGKSKLIESAAEGFFIAQAHREWLVDQLAELLPGAQVIKAGDQWDGRSSIVGMVQTLANRPDIKAPDKIITDEAHHAVAGQYQTVLNRYPDAISEGFTATPQRLDGRGLDDAYDDLICGPQYGELIDDGWLKPFEVYSIPSGFDPSSCRIIGGEYRRGDLKEALRKSRVFGDVVEHWKRHGRDGGHVSFWPSIDAAEHAASSVPGWHALHSKLPKDQVKALISGLSAGTVESLCSVDMISEGLNVPGIASISECRLTASLSVHMQHCGRANRGGEGVARIMDHVGNWRTHGLPDDDREWSLEGRVKRRSAPGSLSVWDCPECWYVNRSTAPACGLCGLGKPRELIVMELHEARLELIKATKPGDIHEVCETPAEYLDFAKNKRKKPTWAALKWAERDLLGSDDPFAEAASDARPTMTGFLSACRDLGINRAHAEIVAEHMSLVDDRGRIYR